MRRWSLFGVILTSLFAIFGFHQNGLTAERYTVKPGDTLLKISKSFRIPVEKLKKANRLEKDSLKLKQVLLIPVDEKTQAAPRGEAGYCLVNKGDNLSIISKRTGVSVEVIKSLNQLRSAALKPGQKLTLLRPKPEKEDMEEAVGFDEVIDLTSAEKERDTMQEPLSRWNSSEERNLFVKVVKNFLGVPYRLGGSTLKGIDCSAFVKKIYEIFNTTLPRTAREQFRFGKFIRKDELQEGDLVFFTRRSRISHVGIYIGNREFVHASSHDKQVKVDNLDMPYFSEHFLRGVRVKELEM